jgi:hypothetical protein
MGQIPHCTALRLRLSVERYGIVIHGGGIESSTSEIALVLLGSIFGKTSMPVPTAMNS